MPSLPKWFRFRFSLRTLMVFMLLLCILFGTVGRRVYRAREQQAILTKIRESHGTCSFANEDSAFPDFWSLLIDSKFLDRIERVYFANIIGKFVGDEVAYTVKLIRVKDEPDIASLLELKNLKHLDISSRQISDLTPLAELKNLERLEISNTQVSDLTPLLELKNLDYLFISNTQVTDEQIQHLQKALPNCEISH